MDDINNSCCTAFVHLSTELGSLSLITQTATFILSAKTFVN
jgi:hypothetical protein